MTFIEAVLLGIVEGFTEFLPVSSTAHLIIASQALGIPKSEFLSSFEIVIQLGAILAVAVLYGKRVLANKKMLVPIMAGFIPTMMVGFLAYDLVKQVFLEQFSFTIAGLLLGGLFLMFVESLQKDKNSQIVLIESIPLKQAVVVGLGQALAMLPGMSRSAMTIGTGKLAGFSREMAVEYSFLLATPVMLGASILDLASSYKILNTYDWRLIATGFITAFVVAYLSMRWLILFAKKHSLAAFGWYRVGLALVLVWWSRLLK